MELICSLYESLDILGKAIVVVIGGYIRVT